ncbi:hypothetical protein QWJ26_08815 [Streptomyces sp. CSDS2]|uniref:hypothetical protein n=1 Tax=Streptomyces sp. CSDS2 TaxID=3055051 RepID=UPI0025B086F3|nr:hypothetical protein [Streptomyces sp. CSDS2]MDN3259903.1 hypothetical protein [Streptomyces sp. CSDS2]
MTGKLSRSVAADGVIAYQDHEDLQKFHYFPARIDVTKETLPEYRVQYYGIGAKPYWVALSGGKVVSEVGGILSGKAVAEITQTQRKNILAEITKVYSVKSPRLVPLQISNATVEPIFAKHIVQKGGDASFVFPSTFTIGGQFNYQVGTGNSLFGELIANEVENEQPNPDFAVNLYGETELYGDPWEAEITADLSQVWSYTRKQVGADIALGWFDLGSSIDKITQDLIAKGHVKIKYIQGSGGPEFGWALLETTKTLFEEITRQAAAGEGIFKMEPNPEPKEPPKNEKFGASKTPWHVSVNLAFGSEDFTQLRKFKHTLEFHGRVTVPVTSSMSLAMTCSSSTVSHFYDLQMKKSECVTKAKSDALDARLKKATDAIAKKQKEYHEKVMSGQWTPSEYREMMELLYEYPPTETAKMVGTKADGTPIFEMMSPTEVNEMLRRAEADLLARRMDPAH